MPMPESARNQTNAMAIMGNSTGRDWRPLVSICAHLWLPICRGKAAATRRRSLQDAPQCVCQRRLAKRVGGTGRLRLQFNHEWTRIDTNEAEPPIEFHESHRKVSLS